MPLSSRTTARVAANTAQPHSYAPLSGHAAIVRLGWAGVNGVAAPKPLPASPGSQDAWAASAQVASIPVYYV